MKIFFIVFGTVIFSFIIIGAIAEYILMKRLDNYKIVNGNIEEIK